MTKKGKIATKKVFPIKRDIFTKKGKIIKNNKNNKKLLLQRRPKEFAKCSVSSLPFKKRKFFLDINKVPYIRDCEVHLIDVFYDEELCKKYNLYEKRRRILSDNLNRRKGSSINGSVLKCCTPKKSRRNKFSVNSDTITDISSWSSSSFNEDATCSSLYTNEISGPTHKESILKCRQVTLENSMITITRPVVQKPSVSLTRNYNSESIYYKTSVSSKATMPKIKRKIRRNYWKIHHVYTMDDKLSVTSSDRMFSFAKIPNSFAKDLIDFPQEVETKGRNFIDSRRKSNTSTEEDAFVSDLRQKKPDEFKVPLPPAKRPPSRIKGSNYSSSSDSIFSRTGYKPVDSFKNDDAISLYAE